VLVDEIDLGEVPARVTQAQPLDVPKPGRYFEANSIQADATVTEALGAGELDAEGAA